MTSDPLEYMRRDLWAGAVILRGALPTFPSVPALPTASVDWDAKVAFVPGGAGGADALYVCLKDAADAYAWVAISGGGGGSTVYHEGQWAYDFAVQGGAIGAHNLTPVDGEASIASGAVLVDAVVVITADFADTVDFASVGINVENAARGPGGDVVAGSTIDAWLTGIMQVGGGFFYNQGFAQNIATGVAAPGYIKTTTARTPQIIIADETVIAGAFTVTMRWVIPS